MQETRALEDQINSSDFEIPDYKRFMNVAEKKDHGDMGQFVGCDISGSALIVDDVISSGSSIIESIDMLNGAKSKCGHVLVAFDRMEIGKSKIAWLELQLEYSTSGRRSNDLGHIADGIKCKSEYKPYSRGMDGYMCKYRAV